MVNMRQALGVDDFNQMSNYTGQLQNKRRSVGQKDYGLGGKALDMAAALGDAYNQYQPPETALGMMALPAKAVYGLGNMIVQDVGDKTKSIMGTDINNPAAMNQAATDAFGLAADTMAGGGVVSRMTDMPTGAVLGANVFQGGPHKYGPEGASESLKHMSKGEGAQAYGYGRYDAENPEVAKSYMSIGGEHVLRSADGKTLKPSELRAAGDESLADAVNAISSMPPDAGVKWLKEIGQPNEAAIAQKLIDDGYVRYFDDTGNLYKHDLPDEDIARYLDWDAPLSEQPDAVRVLDAIPSTYRKPEGGYESVMDLLRERVETHGGNVTGGDAYNLLKTEMRGMPEASKEFAKHGIPGLKYFDGMSRKQTAQATIDGVPVDKYKPKNGYEEYLISKFNAGEPLHEIQKIADMRSEGVDLMKRWNVSVPEGTRNFVTWDQDVLNRMKLLERNGESMTKALMPK
jgi:hypothetical protein